MHTFAPIVMALRNKLKVAACIATVSVPPLLAGCSGHPAGETASAANNSAATVRSVGTVLPAQGNIARTITQPATLQGIEEAMLYAKTAGYLKSISVDKGDRVRAGQVLAVIESPEVLDQQVQARSAYQQSLAAAQGALAAKGRAEADVVQAASAVERARADLARTEATLPKLQAMAHEADATVQQTVEQQAQSRADVGRWQQQLKISQAALRAAQASLQKAQSDDRLQQLTYSRLKAIQAKDEGLVAAQDVDVAQARMESSHGDLEAARNRVDAAQGDVAAAEQQLEGARRQAAAATDKIEAARSHAQAAQEDIQVCRRDIEVARQQVRVTENQRRALGEQVHVADAQVAAARMQSQGSRSGMAAAAALAGYTRLTAPFDGMVTERLADPGSFVQNAAANQASARPLLKVVRDQTLRVLIPVPENDLPFIRKGQRTRLVADAYPKRFFRGTVSRFASAVDPRSRTMLTEVDVPNPDRRLRTGMYTRATLVLEVHRNALSIPSAAVMGPEDKHFVYTVSNGHAHRTPVTVDVDDGKKAEITAGLSPGSAVVLVGRDTLVDGAAVKAEPVQR
jgi:RND family efflux transporter MFP subunit